MCLCPRTEQFLPDSPRTCPWRRLRVRALYWRNVATAKTATAVQHPYLVYKYQSWRLAQPFLTYHNYHEWIISIVLQQQTCSAALFRLLDQLNEPSETFHQILQMGNQKMFTSLFWYSITHNVKSLSCMTKSKC